MKFSNFMWVALLIIFGAVIYFQVNVFSYNTNHAKINKNDTGIYRTFKTVNIVFRVNLMDDVSVDLFNNSEKLFAVSNETYSITVIKGDVLSFYTAQVPKDTRSRIGVVEILENNGKKCNDLYELNYGRTIIEK